MANSGIRWLAAVSVVGPLLVLIGTLAHPTSRAILFSFFESPVDSPRHAEAGPGPSASTVTLAPIVRLTGAESIELRQLLEDAPSRARERPLARARRTALFGGNGLDVPEARAPFTRPSGLRRPGILTRDDPRIDGAMHWLTADAMTRENLVAAIKRSGRWSADISYLLKMWKVPDDLQAIIYVESAFVPTASSKDGGVGLWQLTPEVAHVYGLAMLPTYDERRSIARGTEAAARYLADLRERFGSWELAIVAFNWGYKTTLDELAKHATTNYWDIAPWLPAELSEYVAEVLGTAFLLANLSRFGLDTVKREEPVITSDLDTPYGTSFAVIAQASKTSVGTLHELNPEYSADTVPVASFKMTVHVPAGSYTRAKGMLPLVMQGGGYEPVVDAHDAQPPMRPSMRPSMREDIVTNGNRTRIFYKVQEGDTFASLSRRYGTPVETIASDNAIDPTSSLRPGQTLAIRIAAGAPSPP